ncbi:unnamed protein product [Parascedosporium putredinis]|uniref:CENP-V/GFA domain-containing protein n=1 Tax=Parascedosporium putredinis TaxID=1442378 RepID=A0A9P1H0T8_9PEZI|nr:unnamed protein product [Parascedosporium putredinis]CAI7993101.1 unnamed protein product [Parascedosporium putredinis]
MAPSIHPSIDSGLVKGAENFQGGTIRCHCASNPVEPLLRHRRHPRDNVEVTANAAKLHVVDANAAILRNACKECGVHLFGRIEKEHPFKGLDFVHVELSSEKGWQEPQFAAFVSSIIEQGFHPKGIDEVRAKLESVGLKTYDSLSPPLMDAIATWTAQKSGALPAQL